MTFLFSKRDSIQSNYSEVSSNSSYFEESLNCELQNLVKDVRNKMTNIYIRNPEKYDPNDMVTFVEETEFGYIERYLIKYNCNVQKAVESIDECLKWRKSTGLSTLVDESFPEMFYRYGYMFVFGFDLEGNPMFHIKGKLYNVFHPRVIDAFKEFFLHLMFKIDRIAAARGKQWVLLIDLTDITIRELDISLLIWAFKVYYEKFPEGLKRIILYNMPWFARPLLNTVIKVCPDSVSSLVEIIKKGKLDKYVSKDNLPRHLGGVKDPRAVYSNYADLHDFFKNRYDEITDEDISNTIPKYEKVMASDIW